MKILIINGSPRVGGTTGQILQSIKNNLIGLDNSIETEDVNLSETNLQFCTGCLACYKTGNCNIQDDGQKLISKIENADGIVFGSPTYSGNVTAYFKLMMDRVHFVFRQSLKNKACFSVVTYENAGGKNAQKIINNFIHYSGGAVSSKFIKKTYLSENNKESLTLLKLSKKFLKKAKKKNSQNFSEKLFSKLMFKIALKPHAFKHKDRYTAIIKRWADIGLISRKKVKNELQ